MAIDEAANARVRQALERAVREGGEIGVQVAAYLRGELVIDVWAGLAEPGGVRAVERDTLFNVFSVTKVIGSTTVHLQAERGLLAYDAPIAEYWPEWGCKGKERATVRDALTHCTGVPQMPAGVTPEMLCDWDAMVAALAELTPIFPPGERPAYQAINYGWIVGEIVRRSDPRRRPYRQFVEEELLAPLGITDLYVGIPDAVEPRIARLLDTDSSYAAPEGSLLALACPPAVAVVPAVYERPDVRRACLIGSGGITTARAMARLWGMLANGGELDGVRLLSAERVSAAAVPRVNDAPDPVMFDAVMPLTEGGFWRYDPAVPDICPARGSRVICMPGAGGSLGWADLDSGLAVAFCHNHMRMAGTCEEHPAYAIAEAVREGLGLA